MPRLTGFSLGLPDYKHSAWDPRHSLSGNASYVRHPAASTAYVIWVFLCSVHTGYGWSASLLAMVAGMDRYPATQPIDPVDWPIQPRRSCTDPSRPPEGGGFPACLDLIWAVSVCCADTSSDMHRIGCSRWQLISSRAAERTHLEAGWTW